MGVPLKSAVVGLKRTLAVVGNTSALVSDTPAGTSVHVVPSVEYCQLPPADVVSPTMAMPPKAEAALPPPLILAPPVPWLSVTSE